MKLQEAIYARHSVRQFDQTPIDESTLIDIIKDAQRAPSWANAQPWKVAIATGETLAAIKEKHLARANAGQGGNAEMDVMHRNEWDRDSQQNMQLWNQQVSQTLQNTPAGVSTFGVAQRQLFDATAIVYLLVPKNASGWSLYDLGAFGQTLMLSAVDRGIGSIPAYELVRYPDLLHDQLDAPDTEMFAMGIALGYEKDTPLNKLVTKRVDVTDMMTLHN